MKKLIKVLIFMMIVIPAFMRAETVNYNNAINKVNSYILRENFNKRNNYILFNNPKYIMNDNGELKSDAKYTNGGMLNKKEYDYTLKNGNSWLVIPTKFWLATLNTLNNKYYYLSSNGLQVDEPSEQHDVRVTEFVRPGTQVSGEGTISNPWQFEDVNYATFISSDINKGYFYNGTEVDNNHLGDRKVSIEVIVNNKVATVEINVKKGYVNDTSDGCGLVKVSETSYTNTNKVKYRVNNINGNYNCTVKFIKETYTISYTLNGGKVSTPNPTTYDSETPTITLNNPSKEYYTFDGWTGSNGNTPQKTVTIPKGSTGKKEYVAKFTPITYPISYSINHGTNNSANKTSYTVETPTFSLGAPTMNTGYTFNGWSGTGITGTSTSVSISKGSHGNRSYTASVSPTSYSISYTISNGTNNSSNKTSYNIETDTFSLSAPTPNSGYTFTGWTGSGITVKTKTVKITKGSTGNKSYTGVMCRSCSPGSHATCTLNESDCSYTTGCDSSSYKIKSGANAYNPVCEPNAAFSFKYTGKFKVCTGSNYGTCTNDLSNKEYTIESKPWKVEFKTSGTLTVKSISGNVDIHAVGGGGGGAGADTDYRSGGGGGGYTTTAKNKSLAATNYTVTIGAGGAGGAQKSNGSNGGKSSFGSLCSANGGSGGKAGYPNGDVNGYGGNGGSGGGASGLGFEWKCATGGTGGKDGNNGGYGMRGSTKYGTPGTGQGTTTRDFGETSGTLRAGGGGGRNGTHYCCEKSGDGGSGGGGAAAVGCKVFLYQTEHGPSNGTDNYGGGGGAGAKSSGGRGGSGIVIIRNH